VLNLTRFALRAGKNTYNSCNLNNTEADTDTHWLLARNKDETQQKNSHRNSQPNKCRQDDDDDSTAN